MMLTLAALLLGGCGFFARGGGDDSLPPAPAEARAVVPTFTATPEGQEPTPTATIAFAAQSEEVAAVAVVEEPTPEPTATPTPRPRLIVEQAGINVRTGPGTNFGTGGTANQGEAFDIISKNQAGDWWQVCCVSGEPVWIFGALARVENADNVPVGENLAAQPVAAAPAPAPAQPAAPAPAPAEPAPAPPAEEAAPAPPPANDPCANIGGDGCKFKVRGGPAFSPNGGELKLTLGFIHSGVEGGQPQGSYFVVVLKDGQNLGVPDSVRSFDPSVEQRTGPHGKYNYEYKIPVANLPGGTVAGNYTMWVLDGNAERDSQDVNFSVPDGQGEIWIQFDQG
jgi:pyruvate/2-oxoglutarate dehydrogenase complex dihydrolipoamide acyltransferase (E2) component